MRALYEHVVQNPVPATKANPSINRPGTLVEIDGDREAIPDLGKEVVCHDALFTCVNIDAGAGAWAFNSADIPEYSW